MKTNHEVIKLYNRNFHNVMTKLTGERNYNEILKVMRDCGIDKQFARVFDLRDYEVKPRLVSMGSRDCDVIVTKGAGYNGADDVAIYIFGEVFHIDYDYNNDIF